MSSSGDGQLTPEVVLYRYLQLVNADEVQLAPFVELVGCDADLLSRWLRVLRSNASPRALTETISQLEPWTFVDLAQAQAWSVLPPGGAMRLGYDQWRSVLGSAVLGEMLAEYLGLSDPAAVRWRLHLAMSGVSLNYDTALADLIEFRGARPELLEDAPLEHKILAVLDAHEVREAAEVAEVAHRLLDITPARFAALLTQAQDNARFLLSRTGLDEAASMDRTEELWDLQQVNLLAGLFLQGRDPQSLFAAHELAAKTLFRITPELFMLDSADDQLVSHQVQSPAEHRSLRTDEIFQVPLGSVSSQIAKALRERKDLRIRNSSDCAVADRQVLRRMEVEEGLVLPLLVNDRAVGALVFAVDEEVDQEHLIQTYTLALSRWLATSLSGDDNAHSLELFREREEKRLRELVHEINNPLSIVSNYLHILELRLQHENGTSEQLETIGKELHRAANLLREVRDVPRLIEVEETKAQVKIVQFDINELVRHTYEIHMGYASELDAKLEITLQRGSMLVSSDEQRVSQVVNNLVKNAIEAGGGVSRVHLRTRGGVYREGKRGVEIVIADNGPGLSTDVLDRLYEPKQSNKGGEHAGLGLHIVHRLVNEVRGNIDLRTEAGKGTEFTLFLPLAAQG